MLQNRVNPFGQMITTKARGKWLGNRGQLHGTGKTILRPFKHKAWIICLLTFKGRQREIMAPNLWTELFFLDEATALAAGHRPCFECRREAALLFKKAWLKGNPDFGFDHRTLIGKIDEVMHQERIAKNGQKITFETVLKDVPDGVFIEMDGQAYLFANEMIYPWTPEGYEAGQHLSLSKKVNILTPRSIVNAIKSGYEPQMGLLV